MIDIHKAPTVPFRRNSLGGQSSCAICGKRFRKTDTVWYGGGRVTCLPCYEKHREEIRAWCNYWRIPCD